MTVFPRFESENSLYFCKSSCYNRKSILKNTEYIAISSELVYNISDEVIV